MLPGQGVLQGSSAAASIFIFNSDILLDAYCQLAKGAAFIHPISGDIIEDKVTQYVDDTTYLLNHLGANIQDTDYSTKHDALLAQAQTNMEVLNDTL